MSLQTLRALHATREVNGIQTYLSMTSPVLNKIFLGFLQNGELKMHLNQSPLWKETKLLQVSAFSEVHFENQHYVGTFIQSPCDYSQLKEYELELRQHLQRHCPKLNADKQPLYLFLQLFLA